METKYFLTKLTVSGIWKKYLTITVLFSRVTHFQIMHVNLESNFPNIFLDFLINCIYNTSCAYTFIYIHIHLFYLFIFN